ncbi:hypothetical protein [Haladaptatus sp. ZSTT2]|uniref:hypothetical protein n=1 Tax=Haladaptatus sp. ZSTT2 TaxID=3120515 RepID=UPI00300F06A9
MSEGYERGRAYVRENKDDLVHILRHGSNVDVRAYAYAVLKRYGSKRDFEEVRRELDRVEEVEL